MQCEAVDTERFEWQPLTYKFRQEQLTRWKKFLGALEGELRVIRETTADGETKIFPLHPEWEAYLGQELAGKLRAVVAESKRRLYRHSIRSEGSRK
jgi:hypothetical protein